MAGEASSTSFGLPEALSSAAPTTEPPRMRGAETVREGNSSDSQASRKLDSLGRLDLFSFIVNKMVGSEISTAPMSLYLMTGSRRLTVVLWIITYAYTIMSTLIELNYGSALPYTGSELIYVAGMTPFTSTKSSNLSRVRSDEGQGAQQEVSRPKNTTPAKPKHWKRPLLVGLMMPVITYLVLLISLLYSSSNVIQFGRAVLFMSSTAGLDEHTNSAPLQSILVGLSAFTALCVIHLVTPAPGQSLNKFIAIIKVAAVLALAFAAASSIYDTRLHTCSNCQPPGSRLSEIAVHDTSSQGAVVLLNLLFSFQGRENTIIVAGERRFGRHLRSGLLCTVICVACLYAGVVLGFVLTINLEAPSKSTEAGSISFSPIFTSWGKTAAEAWATIAAASALGGMSSVIYKFSRVRRAISQASVRPWSRSPLSVAILSTNQQVTVPFRAESGSNKYPEALPAIFQVASKGAVALHWIVTVAMMITALESSQDMGDVGILGMLRRYSHMILSYVFSMSGTLFFCLFVWREGALNAYLPDQGSGAARHSKIRLNDRRSVLQAFTLVGIFICVGSSSVLLVLPATSHPLGSLRDGERDSYGWIPAAFNFGIAGFGLWYLKLVFGAKGQSRASPSPGSPSTSPEKKPQKDITHSKPLGSDSFYISWVAEQLQSGDPTKIEVRASQPWSVSNHVKGVVEDFLGERLDWWPLAPRMKEVPTHKRRLMWTCTCGRERHLDVLSHLVAAAIQKSRTSRPVSPSMTFDDVPLTPASQSSSARQPVSRFEMRRLDASSGSTSQSNAENNTYSASDDGSVSDFDEDRDPDVNATAEKLYVFFVVASNPQIGTPHYLAQGRIKVCTTDDMFFKWVQKEYRSLRGWFGANFGFRRYTHCDFFRFEKWDAYMYSPIEQHSFPDSSDTYRNSYQYSPQPMDPIPPISEDQFYHRYYTCYSPSTWHKMLPFHKCRKKCGDRVKLTLLPLRNTTVEVQTTASEHFWGIYAVAAISPLWVFGYSLMLFIVPISAPSVVFFFMWLFSWGHEGDLQNASVPVSISLSVVGLFLAYVAWDARNAGGRSARRKFKED